MIKNEKGFTIIEIVLVFVIICISLMLFTNTFQSTDNKDISKSIKKVYQTHEGDKTNTNTPINKYISYETINKNSNKGDDGENII